MNERALFGRRRQTSTVQQVAPMAWRLPELQHAETELWVVADAAQGIGLELTKQLLQTGRSVIAMLDDSFAVPALRQAAAEHPQHLILLDLDAQTEASITQMVHRVDFTLRTASGPRRAVDVFAYATKRQASLRTSGEMQSFRLSEFQQLLQEEITTPYTVAKILSPAMRAAVNPRVVIFASDIEQDYCLKKSTAYMLLNELRDVYPVTVVAIDPGMEPTEVSVAFERSDLVFQRTVHSCIQMIELLQPDQTGQLYSVRGNHVPW